MKRYSGSKQAAGLRQGCGTVLANIAATKNIDIQTVKPKSGYGGRVLQFFVYIRLSALFKLCNENDCCLPSTTGYQPANL